MTRLKGEYGWFEEYKCGCVSPVVKFKRELVGYCPKHGANTKHVHRVHPALEASRWEEKETPRA
jgi:hypothetical protein